MESTPYLLVVEISYAVKVLLDVNRCEFKVNTTLLTTIVPPHTTTLNSIGNR